MSYLVLALVLSFIVGFIGFFGLVKLNAPAENAYRVVWGSAAFWLVVAGLACLTTGWSSAFAGIAGGFMAFALVRPGDVFFTWGRALIQFANTGFVRGINPVNGILRRIGVKLQNAQRPLNEVLTRRR